MRVFGQKKLLIFPHLRWWRCSLSGRIPRPWLCSCAASDDSCAACSARSSASWSLDWMPTTCALLGLVLRNSVSTNLLRVATLLEVSTWLGFFCCKDKFILNCHWFMGSWMRAWVSFSFIPVIIIFLSLLLFPLFRFALSIIFSSVHWLKKPETTTHV